MKVKYIVVSAISLLVLLSSCVRLTKKPGTITGTFSATLNKHSFQGFFLVSKPAMVIDILNPLGLTSYRIVVSNNTVTIKNYSSQTSTNETEFNKYKKALIFLKQNFTKLCSLSNLPSNISVQCKKTGNSYLPARIKAVSNKGVLKITIDKIIIGKRP